MWEAPPSKGQGALPQGEAWKGAFAGTGPCVSRITQAPRDGLFTITTQRASSRDTVRVRVKVKVRVRVRVRNALLGYRALGTRWKIHSNRGRTSPRLKTLGKANFYDDEILG